MADRSADDIVKNVDPKKATQDEKDKVAELVKKATDGPSDLQRALDEAKRWNS